MTALYPLGLFQGYGVELEYMIVDQETLAVRPIADVLLAEVAGPGECEAELGDLAWSNELVLHVLELKTNGPAPALGGLAARFQASVAEANRLLDPLGARLLPSAMHPLMDPRRETRLWPHEQNEIYRAFDRIFGARGHGWANLQSTHLNLPFADEEEFVRLHAALRPLLALVPTLAASSPIVEGHPGGFLDTRLEHYRHNQRAIPIIAGRVVPEDVRSIADYHERILGEIYRAIAPHDPAGTLRHEWLNSRGAIARFERGAIELRLLDIQECPRADLAILALICATTRALAEERWAPLAALADLAVEPLEAQLLAGIRLGEAAPVTHPPLLAALGLPPARGLPAGELWSHLAGELLDGEHEAIPALRAILARGTLARRILGAVGPGGREAILAVYGELADCLARGELFRPDA